MGQSRNLLVILLLTGLYISACGQSQAELEAKDTQLAEEIFATQTAHEPIATATLTPSPTATLTPTITHSPSPTVDIALREREFVAEVSALMEAEDIQSAIDSCTEGIKADPNFGMGYVMRGLLLLGLNDAEAAVIDFDQAIELGITEDLSKEIEPGMSIKTVHYMRGMANMAIGAYQQGRADLEYFLKITEPLEYPDFRATAQYEIGVWQVEEEPVTSGQQFNFSLYSILAPGGDGWGVQPVGEMAIQFGQLELLDEGETIYSERTTIGRSFFSLIDLDYSPDEFLQFACAEMMVKDDRYKLLEGECYWWSQSPNNCVVWEALVEDYGGVDRPYSPPLIMGGKSLACRHPDFIDVVIWVHYSQRGPEGSLEEDVPQKAESFFQGLSFNNPEE